jgi:hypothetical protein
MILNIRLIFEKHSGAASLLASAALTAVVFQLREIYPVIPSVAMLLPVFCMFPALFAERAKDATAVFTGFIGTFCTMMALTLH